MIQAGQRWTHASLPMSVADDKTVNIKQAEQALGVSRRTIYRYLRSGKLHYRVDGSSRRIGNVRIYLSSLRRMSHFLGSPCE